MPEKCHLLTLVHQAIILFTAALYMYCCEGTSISLSPLGMVSVCPGGQVLLTCERISDSFLHWNVSIPHPMATTREIIVTNRGVLLSPEFRIGFTEFNITRTLESPLISQLLINNVTTEINGSTIYCSEGGNENGAPAITINIISRRADLSLNVTMVNQLLRSDDVTVTLQWPQEPGAVYNISISPEISHTELTSIEHSIFTINVTISYNIQYNVSIVSTLCGVTTYTTMVLNYVTCDYPPTQLLYRPVVVVSGSQDSPPIEGQFITYTCPTGFIRIGTSTSVCMGNRGWEPDPGEVDCIGDHGCRVPLVNRYVKLNFSSTLEGSVLILTCENEKNTLNATSEQVLKVICHSTITSWNPDPTDFIESCSSLYLTTIIAHAETSPWTPLVRTGTANIMMVLITVILIILCAVSSIVFLSIGYACGWFSQKHKQSCTRKAASDSSVEETQSDPHHISEEPQLPQAPGPLYEELQQKSIPEHHDQHLFENVAYGPIIVK